MKKNKLHLFLAGAVASVSAVLIVVSILISSGAAGMDPVFSDTESTGQTYLFELTKDSFFYIDNMGDMKIEDIKATLSGKRMDATLDLLTEKYGVRVERIRYEILDGKATFSGIACNSADILGKATELGLHSFSFTVWQDFSASERGNRKLRIYVDYVNTMDGLEEIHTATAEAAF